MNLEAVEPMMYRGIVANIGKYFKNGRSVIANGLAKWQGKTIYNGDSIRWKHVTHGFSDELDDPNHLF